MTIYIWKDREGNELTFKEFMKRFKEGVMNTTQLQKVKAQMQGSHIMMFGMLMGLIVSIIGYEKLWWVSIILVGALVITTISYISLLQQKKVYEEVEKRMAEVNLDMEVSLDGEQKGMSTQAMKAEDYIEDKKDG